MKFYNINPSDTIFVFDNSIDCDEDDKETVRVVVMGSYSGEKSTFDLTSDEAVQMANMLEIAANRKKK